MAIPINQLVSSVTTTAFGLLTDVTHRFIFESNDGQGSYNPSTGTVTPGTTEFTFDAVVVPIERKENEENDVQVGDLRAYIKSTTNLASAKFRSGDFVRRVSDSARYTIMKMKWDPTNNVLFLTLRRGN